MIPQNILGSFIQKLILALYSAERSKFMSTIEFYNGSTSNKQGSFMIYTLVRDDPKDKDCTIQEAVKDPKSRVVEPGGIIENVPSTKGVRQVGSWTKRRVDCENGVFLKFFMKRSNSGRSFGGLPVQSIGVFWIKARDTAPLREIKIEVPNDHFSTLSRLYITGRFDMVDLAEVRKLGLHKNGNSDDWAMHNPENYEEYITERIIEDEVAPKARVVQKQEGSKTLSRPMRSRRIRPIKR